MKPSLPSPSVSSSASRSNSSSMGLASVPPVCRRHPSRPAGRYDPASSGCPRAAGGTCQSWSARLMTFPFFLPFRISIPSSVVVPSCEAPASACRGSCRPTRNRVRLWVFRHVVRLREGRGLHPQRRPRAFARVTAGQHDGHQAEAEPSSSAQAARLWSQQRHHL